MYIGTDVWMYGRMDMYIYIYMQIYIYIYTYMYLYGWMCLCTYVHTKGSFQKIEGGKLHYRPQSAAVLLEGPQNRKSDFVEPPTWI